MNYVFCDAMYVHDPPQASVSRSSAAQRVNGNLRVRATGFRPSTSPFLGATLRAQQTWKWSVQTEVAVLLLCIILPTKNVVCKMWCSQGLEYGNNRE
jgi:hypothetical protein